jgi:hypothetical protein
MQKVDQATFILFQWLIPFAHPSTSPSITASTATHASPMLCGRQQTMLLELPKNTMDESIFRSPRSQPEDMAKSPPFETAYEVEENTEDMTPEQRQTRFMRAFAGNLKTEGLRSPQYYKDKSQCLSLANCSPAEMGYLKAN